MYQGQSASIVEPLNPLPVQKPVKNRALLFGVISAVELVIIVAMIIVVITLPKDEPVSGDVCPDDIDVNTLGEIADYKEMSVENPDEVLLLYADLKKGNLDLDYSALDTLASGYSELYGGSSVNFDGSVVNALVERRQSEDYPYGQMRVMDLETVDQCAKFEFYDDFEVLHSLKVTNGSCR